MHFQHKTNNNPSPTYSVSGSQGRAASLGLMAYIWV